MSATASSGPLTGLRIVEFEGIGPAPFGVMLLADLGAEVVRVQRADSEWPDIPVVSRGRTSITLDLKADAGRKAATDLAETTDVLVEGFRPGVMERLGLGPDVLLQRNPRLIYARMTGWGQKGPLSCSAGHDLNYVGLTGMLTMLSQGDQPPRAPQNLLGDYAGGGLYMALGILAALYERQRSGSGQVVDAAIVDGCASLLAPILGMIAAGVLPADPSQGMLAGASPFYRTYACADSRFVAVGALEPRFQRALSARLGLDVEALEEADAADQLREIFATRTRDQWIDLLSDCDCCVSPVLDVNEARDHAHIVARSIFFERDGVLHPAPAPRFSRTPATLPAEPGPLRWPPEWRAERADLRR